MIHPSHCKHQTTIQTPKLTTKELPGLPPPSCNQGWGVYRSWLSVKHYEAFSQYSIFTMYHTAFLPPTLCWTFHVGVLVLPLHRFVQSKLCPRTVLYVYQIWWSSVWLRTLTIDGRGHFLLHSCWPSYHHLLLTINHQPWSATNR